MSDELTIGPHEEWEYRDVTCRIYVSPTPTSARYAGYAKIGDEWIELVDETETTIEDAKRFVEIGVDDALLQAKLSTEDEDDSLLQWDTTVEWDEPYWDSTGTDDGEWHKITGEVTYDGTATLEVEDVEESVEGSNSLSARS